MKGVTLDAAKLPYLTPDRILAHPKFTTARDAYIEAVLGLYETKPSSIELMRDGGRIMVYGIIMALWGGYQEQELDSLPTIGRIKRIVSWFGVASSRQVDLILARFSQAGHVQIIPSPRDRRMRIVLPTPALIEHDRAFIRAHYLPLAELFGDRAYILPLAGDLAFLKAMRAAWIATLGSMAKEIFIANRPVLRFYAASAGFLMLMKLVRLQHGSAERWVPVDYTDFGRRFGVSRTHVRTLFKAVAAYGDMEFSASGLVSLDPRLIAAFDRNIAGRMSLLELAHLAAIQDLRVRIPGAAC